MGEREEKRSSFFGANSISGVTEIAFGYTNSMVYGTSLDFFPRSRNSAPPRIKREAMVKSKLRSLDALHGTEKWKRVFFDAKVPQKYIVNAYNEEEYICNTCIC